MATLAVSDRSSQAPAAEDDARAGVYSVLGACLSKPPTQALLNHLAGIACGEASAGSLAGAWAGLVEAAGRADVGDVEQEYNDLFIGVGRGELVPHGSWYLAGFLNDKPLADLRADLALLGIERQENVHEPEDHVAALCETMSLIVAEPEAFDFERQREFFQRHMEPWLGKFFEDLKAAKAARFYRAVADMGKEFMSIESQYFSMLV